MRQVTALVVLVMLAFASNAGAANFWFEPQVTHSNGKNKLGVNGGINGNFSGPFGYYAFGQVSSNGYRQLYAGPTWKPASWLEVGIGVGKENMPDSTRRNAYFWVGHEGMSVFGTFENGGSGPWHKMVLNYRLNDAVGIGVMDQAFLGFGPRVEYNIKKGVQLWGAVLRDNDTNSTNAKLAVKFSF